MTRGLALLLALSLGCASFPARQEPVPTTPGAKLVATADQVAQQYGCAKRKLPHFVLEESTATPTPIAAGAELDHRLAYALCPARADTGVSGKLRTRILYEGKAVVDDSADYQLLPGRIVVDTLIGLPPTAPPGGYELEVSFIGASVRFSTKLPFAVKP
jgi:hypothetical protein